MSNQPKVGKHVEVDLSSWSNEPENNPAKKLERQATEAFLVALAMTDSCKDKIFLKGGILIDAVYASGRNTADIDFSTSAEPSLNFPDQLRGELLRALPLATAKLGMPDLIIDLQSVKFRPREETFVEASYPAISAKFAYAERGTVHEKRLASQSCTQVIHADISFNEPIDVVQNVRLLGPDVDLLAYSLEDLVAEKFRAILQQKTRNRYRRQDVFDLHHLIARNLLFDVDRDQLLTSFLEKCSSRGIVPDQNSLQDLEVRDRSKREWTTLEAEVDQLPEFDKCYALVEGFYRNLPWP